MTRRLAGLFALLALLGASAAAQVPQTTSDLFTWLEGRVKPLAPRAVNPLPGATNVAVTALEWSALGATRCDVYLGPTAKPPLLASGVPCGGFVVVLEQSHKYFWKIVAANTAGAMTGPVWSFTTGAELPLLDLTALVLDASALPIVGAKVTALGPNLPPPAVAPRTSDGNGFVHFPVYGPVLFRFEAQGFVTREVNLPPVTGEPHRVHMTRGPPVPGVAGWTGRLSIASNQRGFLDELGAWQLPVLAHFGEAFSAYVHDKTADGIDVEEQLIRIKAAGYDGVRVWIHLGFYQGAWKGKEVSPWSFQADDGTMVSPTPDYYPKLIEFLRLLQRHGLTLHLTQGDLNRISAEAVRAHYAHLADLIDEAGLRPVIAFAEAINEDHVNGRFGPGTLRSWVAPFKARGYLVGSSCPGGCSEEESDLRAYTEGFSYFTVHGFRNGEASNRLQHIFTLGLESPRWTDVRVGLQGEPTGPNEFPGLGVSVGHTEDVEELGLLAVESLIARQAWVYMSQYGVFWNGRIDRHKGFVVVPKMRATLKAFAPDVMTWTLLHGGRTNASWCAPAGCGPGFAYGDPGVTTGVRRIDQAVSPDGRGVALVVHGGRPPFAMKNFMGCPAKVQVVRAKDDETVQSDEVTVPAGGTLPLDYRIGRLLLARCAA